MACQIKAPGDGARQRCVDMARTSCISSSANVLSGSSAATLHVPHMACHPVVKQVLAAAKIPAEASIRAATATAVNAYGGGLEQRTGDRCCETAGLRRTQREWNAAYGK
ncbi:hypothetical protein BJ912DRAFT_926683 [Pholiota molesta]|nr:hypothetical protein BJ912DRAFT_926683 [Pholiota molesta]